MASILDLMNHVQQQGDIGTQRAKTTRLGQLMAQGYQQGGDRSQLMGQIAQVDPNAALGAQKSFGADDDAKMERIGQMASMLLALPAEARAQAYPQIAQQLHGMGMGQGLPDQWDESMLPTVQGIAQQLGSAGPGGNVQSTYIDAQGNRVAIMRDGSTQVLGQNAPSNQIIDTGNGFFGVNKSSLQAAPVMTGGQAQQPRAPGEVPFSIDPSLPPEVQASIRQNESAFAAVPDGGSVQIGQQGQQLRSAPKPSEALQIAEFAAKQSRTLSPEEAIAKGYAPGTMVQVDGYGNESVKQQPAEKPMSEYQRSQVKQKLVKAKTSIRGTTDDLDRMAAMAKQVMDAPGLERTTGLLGMAPNIPGGAAADAEAKLNSLKSQIAFAVLAKMRAMSPTGGALGSVSDAEGKRLEANLASLDKAQSYEQLRQNLQQIIDYTQTSKQNLQGAFQDDFGEFEAGSPAPGGMDSRRKALLDKY